MGRRQIKEGRYEFRPSPEATYILDALAERWGLPRAGVVELALRKLAETEGLPPFTGAKVPGGANLTAESPDDGYKADSTK